MRYIALYLISIVLANILAAIYGPNATPYIAFFLIGFDITCRDKLHETWHDSNLKAKMLLLVLSGTAISYLLNTDVQKIAVASGVAFFCATLLDTLIYSLFYRYPKLIKINLSNSAASVADSIIFIGLAFGSPILWGIVGKQILFKLLGGFVWGWILEYTFILRHQRSQMEPSSR